MSEEIWLPLANMSWRGYARELPSTCYIGKIYYYFEGRNAWHWTWSTHYAGDRAFGASLSAVKRAIERERVQGSTWTIREIPAIVIGSGRLSIAVVQINTNAPFKRLDSPLGNRRTLKGIAEGYAKQALIDAKCFVCEPLLVPPIRFPFHSYQSFSSGGSYQLNWRKGPMRWDLDGIIGEHAKMTNRIQRIHLDSKKVHITNN